MKIDACRMAIGRALFHNAVTTKKSKCHFINKSNSKQTKRSLANPKHYICCITISIFQFSSYIFTKKNPSCLYYKGIQQIPQQKLEKPLKLPTETF